MKHTPASLRSLAAAAACGVAFSSCVVQTHFGQTLRDATTEYTGVDTYHPVDGKVYYTKAGGKERFYMLAPEVTYSVLLYPSVAEFYDSSPNSRQWSNLTRVRGIDFHDFIQIGLLR